MCVCFCWTDESNDQNSETIDESIIDDQLIVTHVHEDEREREKEEEEEEKR